MIICATALSVATLGILAAALVKTENQAGGLTTLIVLVLAVISGSLSDSIQLMGPNLVTPHYWARQGLLNVLQRGLGWKGCGCRPGFWWARRWSSSWSGHGASGSSKRGWSPASRRAMG